MGSVPFVGSVDSLPPLTIFIFFRRFSYVKLLDMKRLIRIALVAAVAFSTMGIATAQNSKADKKEKIKAMIEGNRYFFEADYAVPQRGVSRQLTDLYDLKISKDSIAAYLPYFGRAYMAPNPGSDEGGIKFTTTNFSYNEKQGKKGGWEISIKPKDNNMNSWRDVQQMQLDISADGYASLEVISSHRDPILFQGSIVATE